MMSIFGGYMPGWFGETIWVVSFALMFMVRYPTVLKKKKKCKKGNICTNY